MIWVHVTGLVDGRYSAWTSGDTGFPRKEYTEIGDDADDVAILLARKLIKDGVRSEQAVKVRHGPGDRWITHRSLLKLAHRETEVEYERRRARRAGHVLR